jgi:L,D-transpeptidase catalytic domain
MRKIKIVIIFLLGILVIYSCRQSADKKAATKVQRKRVKPANTSYHFENAKEWLKKNNTASQKNIVLAVNRTDSSNFAKMDSVLVPNDITGDVEFYLPFPLSVPYLKEVKKIIFFSYPSQTFAAYEMGELIYTGPTNMGRKADPTPTGLYYTNWKAEKTTSTFNDEWDLKWNFNIENKLGIGFHQYELPGYPASHSCLRLQEKDARYLYEWADQWILVKDDSIAAKGTPVIVFGAYPFGAAKPWLQLINDPHILDIPESIIQQLAAPYLQEIILQQQKRAAVEVDK